MKTNLLCMLLIIGCFGVSAQECLTDTVETTPDDIFTENTDGTVLHSETGLIWLRCAAGQTWDQTHCTGDANTFTWQEALAYAVEFDADLLEGWRLPNVKELASLTERNCVRPAINTTFFPDTPPDSFWSSTPSTNNPLNAWTVAFFNASHSEKEKHRAVYVRLVKTYISD